MKLEGLRQIIKEELIRVLNEDTFHNGDTVLYGEERLKVVKDEGNIGIKVEDENGKIRIISRSQLTRTVKEGLIKELSQKVNRNSKNLCNSLIFGRWPQTSCDEST